MYVAFDRRPAGNLFTPLSSSSSSSHCCFLTGREPKVVFPAAEIRLRKNRKRGNHEWRITGMDDGRSLRHSLFMWNYAHPCQFPPRQKLSHCTSLINISIHKTNRLGQANYSLNQEIRYNHICIKYFFLLEKSFIKPGHCTVNLICINLEILSLYRGNEGPKLSKTFTV